LDIATAIATGQPSADGRDNFATEDKETTEDTVNPDVFLRVLGVLCG